MEAHERDFIQPVVTEAVEACERAAKAGLAVPEEAVRALLRPAGAPGVWRIPLFTDRFCTMLLEELAHYERSGLPLRRPNGMNRYGAILDELGFSASLDHLCRRYLRPLGQLLYPWLIAAGDADEHYGFVVKYKSGHDVSLAEHADASVLTLNANLGIRGFRGGALTFRGTRGIDERPKEVPISTVDFSDFSPGEAILHLGGQYVRGQPSPCPTRSHDQNPDSHPDQPPGTMPRCRSRAASASIWWSGNLPSTRWCALRRTRSASGSRHGSAGVRFLTRRSGLNG